ncbi:MAG: abortive infection system antitoxin AbiGi family protein, partial [Candidatus Omnitrophica bacterium]|nr:abortive infection system antitoxin AbiGi family protein [Candidatus Omnitrophota bacterium]
MEENSTDAVDYLQRFSTKTLWHFTGYNKSPQDSFARLVSIASAGLLKISDKSFTIKMPTSGVKRIGFPSSSVCDIPFKDLRLHILRYGGFGIAFNRKRAIRDGHFNPVLYINKDHVFLKHADQVLPELERLASGDQALQKLLQEYLTMIGTYVVRSDLTSPIHIDPRVDEEQNNNFYYEREWRSAYNWNFKKDDVITVMMPQNYIGLFNQTIKGSKSEEIFRDL